MQDELLQLMMKFQLCYEIPSPTQRGAAALLLTLAITGCALNQETRRSLGEYVQAMNEVEQSANLFVSDFADGLKVQKELQRVAGAGPLPAPREYPDQFVSPANASQPTSDAERAVNGTRQALAVVRQYNDALVALAEGQSEQDVRTRTMEFGGSLQGLASIVGASIPGLSLLTDVGSKIIKLAQDARNREQLVFAVNEGRGPVGDILTVLEDQTPSMYRLSVVGTKQGQERLQDDIQRTASALRTLLSGHAAPSQPELGTKVSALQMQLGEIGAKTRMLPTMPLPLPFSGGKPVYDAATDAQAQIFVQSMRTNAQRYAELVAKQNAYHELLLKYVAALRQTRSSLDRVAESLSRPIDLRAEVGRLLKVAFDLRDAMAAYRNPAPAPAA
jgi:hypothetical protein